MDGKSGMHFVCWYPTNSLADRRPTVGRRCSFVPSFLRSFVPSTLRWPSLTEFAVAVRTVVRHVCRGVVRRTSYVAVQPQLDAFLFLLCASRDDVVVCIMQRMQGWPA